jgi:hypothetical protein
VASSNIGESIANSTISNTAHTNVNGNLVAVRRGGPAPDEDPL